MLNGASWIGLVLIAPERLIPEPALIAVAVVLSLPLAAPFVLSGPPEYPGNEEIVVACIAVGVNTLAWGYGIAWLWHNVFRRYSLLKMMSLITIICVLLGVAARIRREAPLNMPDKPTWKR